VQCCGCFQLQHLPIEMLEMILLKCCMWRVLDQWEATAYVPSGDMYRELATVWSEWWFRMTRIWFIITLKKRLNQLSMRSLIVILYLNAAAQNLVMSPAAKLSDVLIFWYCLISFWLFVRLSHYATAACNTNLCRPPLHYVCSIFGRHHFPQALSLIHQNSTHSDGTQFVPYFCSL